MFTVEGVSPHTFSHYETQSIYLKTLTNHCNISYGELWSLVLGSLYRLEYMSFRGFMTHCVMFHYDTLFSFLNRIYAFMSRVTSLNITKKHSFTLNALYSNSYDASRQFTMTYHTRQLLDLIKCETPYQDLHIRHGVLLLITSPIST